MRKKNGKNRQRNKSAPLNNICLFIIYTAIVHIHPAATIKTTLNQTIYENSQWRRSLLLIYDNRSTPKKSQLVESSNRQMNHINRSAKFARDLESHHITHRESFSRLFLSTHDFSLIFFFFNLASTQKFQFHNCRRKEMVSSKTSKSRKLLNPTECEQQNERWKCVVQRYSTEKNWLVISIFRRKLDQTPEHFMASMKFYARHTKITGERCVPISSTGERDRCWLNKATVSFWYAHGTNVRVLFMKHSQFFRHFNKSSSLCACAVCCFVSLKEDPQSEGTKTSEKSARNDEMTANERAGASYANYNT